MRPSRLGVVIVSYNSTDVILDCLETLLSSAAHDGTLLSIAVVDNASPDNTPQAIRDWASGKVRYQPPAGLPMALANVSKPILLGQSDPDAPQIDILDAGRNGGFAAGVNIGLAHLFTDPQVDRVWVLNPDGLVPPGTPKALLTYDPGPFSLMGGRVLYLEHPDQIQIDGGLINRKTGVTGNFNQYGPTSSPLPKPAQIDFISGANMLASRQFYERVGPMREDYFLYYEEVDWALQRGDLPLAICPEGVIYHHGGSVIGSHAVGRPASPFSQYFKHRARHKFVRRHMPRSLPMAWAYTLAKAGQLVLKGDREGAWAMVLGASGARPPAAIAAKLDATAMAELFGE